MLGWREYFASTGEGLTPLDRSLPLASYLGVLGVPGFTGWYGLTEIGQPKTGETLVVSGAAGATGSLVVQLGKLRGCRVVAPRARTTSASGSPASWGRMPPSTTAAAPDLFEALRDACPKGVDIYFENVGGAMLDAVLRLVNPFARIPSAG